MRITRVFTVLTVFLLIAAPSFAQTEHGYIEGTGRITVSSAAASASGLLSGNAQAEVGARVAPHVMAFGDVGRFRDLQPATLQASVDSTVAMLSASDGLNVLGTARTPANYLVGGLRLGIPTHSRLSPFALGGIGFARLSPKARLTYSNGTIPGADPALAGPSAGQDVTSDIVNAGAFTLPAAFSALMLSLGGGATLDLSKRWGADAGYRFSRIAGDTPLRAQGATFGVSYRF